MREIQKRRRHHPPPPRTARIVLHPQQQQQQQPQQQQPPPPQQQQQQQQQRLRLVCVCVCVCVVCASVCEKEKKREEKKKKRKEKERKSTCCDEQVSERVPGLLIGRNAHPLIGLVASAELGSTKRWRDDRVKQSEIERGRESIRQRRNAGLTTSRLAHKKRTRSGRQKTIRRCHGRTYGDTQRERERVVDVVVVDRRPRIYVHR